VTSRERFAQVVRTEPVDVGLACLLIGGEVTPDLPVEASLATLDELAAEARKTSLAEALADFHGEPSDYEDLRSSLLHEVLQRRRGLPILLSVVWCEVAARIGIPAACLGLPGHVLVSVDGQVRDPFHGGVVRDVPPEPVLSANDLLLRVLTNIRALSARRSIETVRTRLWAVELSLLLPHHPLELRRERGELLVRVGEHVRGAVELETFASLVPDEDVAEQARRSARLARSRLN